MSTERRIPRVLERLIDDAAVFPPGNAAVPDAVAAHAQHRRAWYADLVGPLLLPVSALASVPEPGPSRLGMIVDTGLAGVPAALAAAAGSRRWVQLEVAVAKRGEDPQPGLRQLVSGTGASGAGAVGVADTGSALDVYAELPLTWGLLGALDTVAAERAAGARIAPKFRTGGLAAELFPTPVELAAVICACRDRSLPYKLTAGLHHALRHTDPETGFTHHGFLNVLAADLAAAGGAEVADVAELLGSTDPRPITEVVQDGLDQERPLWVGYGSCSIDEPLADLATLDLVGRGHAGDGEGR